MSEKMTTREGLDFERLNLFISEGRLLRRRWKDTDDQGRERACLMAALYPPCGERGTERACPAALMPTWLSSLSVWIDDNGTDVAWLGHVRRYAEVIRRVVALPAAALEALSRRVRVVIVREAVSHVTVDEWGARAACEQVIAALEDGVADKIAAAHAAARASSAAAAAAYADAAYAARAAAAAAYAGAAAYDASAAAAAAYADAAYAAAYDARAAAAAADRMIGGFLAAMEQAVAS